MVYAIIAGGVFLSDLILKRYMDKKYARKVRHPRLGGRIVLEKYYNKGSRCGRRYSAGFLHC